VPGLRCLDCCAGGDPILGQVVVGIGEARPALRVRGFLRWLS
jgi:hypothetical protein